jgi:hypothetical protein
MIRQVARALTVTAVKQANANLVNLTVDDLLAELPEADVIIIELQAYSEEGKRDA